jgi:hypothetical protein
MGSSIYFARQVPMISAAELAAVSGSNVMVAVTGMLVAVGAVVLGGGGVFVDGVTALLGVAISVLIGSAGIAVNWLFVGCGVGEGAIDSWVAFG